jgi:uncharacterized coiled-coil protein SlyX
VLATRSLPNSAQSSPVDAVRRELEIKIQEQLTLLNSLSAPFSSEHRKELDQLQTFLSQWKENDELTQETKPFHVPVRDNGASQEFPHPHSEGK